MYIDHTDLARFLVSNISIVYLKLNILRSTSGPFPDELQTRALPNW